MKGIKDQLKELTNKFDEDINYAVLNLLSVKFSEQISHIVKYSIKDTISYHINETMWIEEIKANLRTWITDYQKELNEQSKQLNARMDFIEQRLLDFMQKIETEYSKKAVFEHLQKQSEITKDEYFLDNKIIFSCETLLALGDEFFLKKAQLTEEDLFSVTHSLTKQCNEVIKESGVYKLKLQFEKIK